MSRPRLRKKVVILREIPPAAERRLKSRFQVEVNRSGRILTRAQLYRRVRGAHAIIALLTDRIDEPVLAAAGDQLSIVANYAVGYDNLDLPALKNRGIIATNTPGQLTESVAEHALALMLTVARRVAEGDRYVRSGKFKQWEPLILYGRPLLGRTVGVIGTGRIGGAFAALCHRGLRMRVLYHDVTPNRMLERECGARRVGLTQLLAGADIVSLHVPLLPSTRHLISGRELLAMKPTAILINTARGPVVNELALVKALHERRLWGAGLDVFEYEPQLAAGLKRLKNVVLTPHIGSATEEARVMMAEMAANNVLAVLTGRKPLNPLF